MPSVISVSVTPATVGAVAVAAGAVAGAAVAMAGAVSVARPRRNSWLAAAASPPPTTIARRPRSAFRVMLLRLRSCRMLLKGAVCGLEVSPDEACGPECGAVRGPEVDAGRGPEAVVLRAAETTGALTGYSA